MQRSDILAASEETLVRIAHDVRVGYALKRTMRYSSTRDVSTHSESVAEHVFALMHLANFFLPLEDTEHVIQKAHLFDILLYHDFSEILHGDTPYHIKTATHIAQEAEDAQKIFASLPSHIGSLGLACWEEYEKRTTPEARFAYALDKVEPLFELLDPVNEHSMKRLDFTYEQNIGVKHRATEHYPIMRAFVDAISNDMRTRDVFRT